LGPTYNPTRNGGTSGAHAGSPSTSTSSSALTSAMFSQANTSPTYSMQQFQPFRNSQMPPPLQEQMPYNSQQSPISPTFQVPNLRSVSMQSLTSSVPTTDIQTQNAFSGPMFDPSNPALFNFDLEGLNFGNHYGALEFSMLNHMSSNAADDPEHDNGSMSQQGGSDAFSAGGSYNNSMGQYGQMYPQQDSMISEFVGMDNNPGYMSEMQRNHILPRAYAIETASASHHSPSTDNHSSPQPSLAFENSPTSGNYNASSNVTSSMHNQPVHHRQQKRQDSKLSQQFGKSSLMNTPKRTRDPSSIYTQVAEPYSYTTGFHNLIAFIQRRFSPNNTVKIAKSLASIRPSFIACTKTLNRPDLIFMEKCFQRTLFEYEEFMRDWGTPTVVCRRTGEVAAVNKEFTLLTGWTKSVLLGKEPNLNINTGKPSKNASGSGSQGGSGRGGLTTPRMRLTDLPKGHEGRPQTVFLAELIDDDTVLEFYEDFAKLAFGDPRGYVQKLCKLLKYQTKDGPEADGKTEEHDGERKRKHVGSNSGILLNGRVSKIDGENGIMRLQKDGRLDCAYCWTVKRDVFDIPMLIIMNVSMAFSLISVDTDAVQFLPIIT
jgi:hypothetical protein